MRAMFRRSSLVFALLALVVGCSSAGKPPSTPSSGGQTSYAIRYGDELVSATKAASDSRTRAKQLSGGFVAHVEQLKKPDWAKVETIIDDSDAAGKSADFADSEGEATAVKHFWESEKNELAGRVNGTLQAKLKESGCGGDIGGSVGYAMQDALQKQTQKKLRASNEAFVVIERYKTSLGPQNVSALEKLADDVAEASYAVHVALVLQKNRLDRLVADRSEVKKTLDRFIQEETAFQGEPGRTEPEKKASADRVTNANRNKAEIDGSAQQAEGMAKELEKSIDAATKEYEDALKATKAKVAERKKADGGDAPPAKK